MSWWSRSDDLAERGKKMVQEEDERRDVERELSDYRRQVAGAVYNAKRACGSDREAIREIEDTVAKWNDACGDASNNLDLSKIVKARDACLDTISAAVDRRGHR